MPATNIKLTPAELEILSVFTEEAHPYTYTLSTARKILHLMHPDVIVMASSDEIYNSGLREGLFKEGGTISKTRSRYMYSIRKFKDWIEQKFNEGEYADTWFEPEWMEEHAV